MNILKRRITFLLLVLWILALHLPNPLRWLDENPPRSMAFSLRSLGFVCGIILKNYLKASCLNVRNTVFLIRLKKKTITNGSSINFPRIFFDSKTSGQKKHIANVLWNIFHFVRARKNINDYNYIRVTCSVQIIRFENFCIISFNF